MHPAKTGLFAAPDDDQAIDEAKAYIARYNLTSDDVKIMRRNGQVLVETKRDVELAEIQGGVCPICERPGTADDIEACILFDGGWK